MQLKNNALINYPQLLPFWNHLNQQERDLVMQRLTILHFDAGQLLRGGDQDCFGFFCVIKGMLRAFLLSPEGKEITLFRMRENDNCILSASCVLEAVSFDTHVIVEESADILLLPIDAFASLIQSNIYVERDCYKLTAERFSDVVAGMERLLFFNIEQRIVSFLLDESSNQNNDLIRMTHEQIAVNIGSAREVVSRTLKTLVKKNYIELFRGGVRLINKAALYELLV